MVVNKAYKFELDPNNKQRTSLFKHACVARFAWNWSLARRITLFKTKEGKERFTTSINEHKELCKLKKTDFPWMYEVSKCAPQEALRNLDKAFSNFWNRRKEGVGFPKFKSKHRTKNSFSIGGSVYVKDNKIILPRVGSVRIKEDIADKLIGKIGYVSLSERAGRWFVSIPVEENIEPIIQTSEEATGIDLGISTFATLSCNNSFEKVPGPNSLEKSLHLLKVRGKAHSRKKKGSNNRKKAAKKLANLHYRISNIRVDFLHKFTTRLAKTKPVIVIEDLSVGNLLHNRKLSRRISDQAWSMFRSQLEYKTTWYGSKLIVADRFYPSSKRCSVCGTVLTKLSLSIRDWICPICNTHHDRDENASHNLELYPKFSGIKICKDQKPVEISEVNGVCETGTKQLIHAYGKV